MAEINLNSKYSPGIPTYGIPGEKGEDGNNGVSMFFIPFTVEDNKDTLLSYINDNKIIGLEGEKNIRYIYQQGDTFVQPNGDVYQFYNNNFKQLGSFNLTSKQPFELNSNNVLYNTNNSKIVISNEDIENIKDDGFLFSIKNISNTNGVTITNFLKIQNNDKYLNLRFDEDNNLFNVDSNSELSFSNFFILDNDSSTINNKKYYKLLKKNEVKEVLNQYDTSINNDDISIGYEKAISETGNYYNLVIKLPEEKYKYDTSNDIYFILIYYKNNKVEKEILLNEKNSATIDEKVIYKWYIDEFENNYNDNITCELNIIKTNFFNNKTFIFNSEKISKNINE